MTRILVLGGCGAVGRVAVQTLIRQPDVDRVVIGDIRAGAAAELAAELDSPKLATATVDAADPESIGTAVAGADVVLNCVGPFYKTVETVLDTVLDAGIDYVDVCDDVDVTLRILDWHGRAEAAGRTALIGMGSSPGTTNLLAAFAARTLLDEAHSVDIFHAHGGEPVEGAGVIGHRFHCMSIPIPMYLDGELRYVDYFGEDGKALRQTFDFPVLGDGIPIYPYPHPEQVTLPRHIPLRQVTNKGTVLPDAYYELTRDACALGLNSREPVSVDGRDVVPADFAIAYILRERERILRETEFGSQRGCVSVLVKGRKDGEPREYRFHLASGSQALGEGTGIPAAMGTLLVARGQVATKGVLPPEACVDPLDFMAMLPDVMELASGDGGDGFAGVTVEEVRADGSVRELDVL